ncbi:MAG: cob(I)yrinic acid a,c-diamide adenosyltransferase [Muribaculaceae bacterium]|nr:cob(I)yrinic acid a,c-diamide adenosyltransferase [Muribaculaceae bacterium]
MKKSLLYTRTGDAGTTALVGGSRIAKNSLRVSAYGDVDELNSHLGLVQAYAAAITGAETEASMLLDIERMLFSIGATLATPGPTQCKALTPEALALLETSIDTLDSIVEPQRNFILPGGTVAAAEAHVARTVCRRAERSILTLNEAEPVDPAIISYINRLSDWLFILARRLNSLAGVSDIKV